MLESWDALELIPKHVHIWYPHVTLPRGIHIKISFLLLLFCVILLLPLLIPVDSILYLFNIWRNTEVIIHILWNSVQY
jgi:hypothetical protein